MQLRVELLIYNAQFRWLSSGPCGVPGPPIWTVIMVLIILEGGGTNGFMSVRATMDAMAVSFEYKYNRGPPRVIELFYLVEVADLPVAFW